MGAFSNPADVTEFRVALIDSSSKMIMTICNHGGFYLPRVRIPNRTALATEINDEICGKWSLKTILLSFLPPSGAKMPCAVAEVISSGNGIVPHSLTLQSLDSLSRSELTTEERDSLERVIAGTPSSKGPFARLGWFREAQDWIERSATDCKVQFSEEFRQFSVSETFTLVQIGTTSDRPYWLKATGEPCVHEYALTVELTKRFSQHLPVLRTGREDWNAWVTEDAGKTLGNCQDLEILLSAVESLADLQMKSLGEVAALKAAGCMDRNLCRVQLHRQELFEFIEKAMQLQTSTKVKPLTPIRLREIASVVDHAIERMQDLQIPDCLVNGDINLGNILFDGTTFRFIDWSEGGIGNPFLTLQQVIQHVIREGEHFEWVPLLCTAYKKKWLTVLDERQINGALRLMPLVTMADYLYGRGDWLRASPVPELYNRFARTLGRNMDRAATDLLSAEVP